MWVGAGANPTVVENVFVGHFGCSSGNNSGGGTHQSNATTPSASASLTGTPPSGQHRLQQGGHLVAVSLRLDAQSRGSFAGNRFAFNTVGIVAHPATTALLVRNYFQNNATGLVYDVDAQPLPSAVAHRSSSVKDLTSRSMSRVAMEKESSSKPTTALKLATGRQSIADVSPEPSRVASRATPARAPSLQRGLDVAGTATSASRVAGTEEDCCPSPSLLLHDMLTAAPGGVPQFAEGLIVLDNPDEPFDDCGGPMLLGNVFLGNTVGVLASAPAARLEIDANCFLNQPISLQVPHADTTFIYTTNSVFHATTPPVASSGRIVAHQHLAMRGGSGHTRADGIGRKSSQADAEGDGAVAVGRSLLHRCIFFGGSASVCIDDETSNLSLFECVFVASGLRSMNGSTPLVVACSFVGYPALIRKGFDCARGGNQTLELVSDPQAILWCLKSAAGFLYSPRIPLSRASFAGTRAVAIEDAGCVLRHCSISLYQEGIAIDGCTTDTVIDACYVGKTRDVGVLIDRGGFNGTLSNSIIASNFGYGLVVKGRCVRALSSTSSPTAAGGGGGSQASLSPMYSKVMSPRRKDTFAASAVRDNRDDLVSDASLSNLMDGGASMYNLHIVEHDARPLLESTDELEARFAQVLEAYRNTEAALLLPDARRDRPYNGTDKYPKVVTASSRHPVVYRCPELVGPGIGVCVEPTGSVSLDRCVFSGAHTANVVVMTKLKAVLHNCVLRDAQGFGAVVRIGAAPTFARCHILRNGYCGLLAEAESRPRIAKCVVHGNRIGLFGAGDASVVAHTTFVGHTLCAVRATQGSVMAIDKCHVERNQGGIEVHHSAILLTALCVQNNALCGIVVSGACADPVASPTASSTSSARGGSTGSPKSFTATTTTATTGPASSSSGPAVPQYRDTTILDSLVRGNRFGGIVLRNGGMCWVQRVLVHKNFHGLVCRTHSILRISDCTFESNHVGALLEYSAMGSIAMSLFTRNLEHSILARTEADVHVRHNMFIEDAPVTVVMEGRGVFVHNTIRKPSSNCFVIGQGGRPTIAFTRFLLMHGSSAELLHAKLLEERDPDRMKDLLPSAVEGDGAAVSATSAAAAASGSPLARRQEALATQQHFIPTTEELKAFVMPMDETIATGGKASNGASHRPTPPAASPPFASLTPAQGAGLPGQDGSRVPSRGGTTSRSPSSIAFVSGETPAIGATPQQPATNAPLLSVEGREDTMVPLQDIDDHESASYGEDRALTIMRATTTEAAARRRLSIAVHRSPAEASRRKSYVLPALADDGGEGGGSFDGDGGNSHMQQQQQRVGAVAPSSQHKRTSFFVPAPGTLDGSGGLAASSEGASNGLLLQSIAVDSTLQNDLSTASTALGTSGAGNARTTTTAGADKGPPRNLSVTSLQQPRRISVHRLDVTFPKTSVSNVATESAPRPTPRTQLQQDLVSDVRDLLQASASRRSAELSDSSLTLEEAQPPLLMDHLRSAILVEAGGGGLISNCIFAHNQPCSILCDGPGANPTIEYCLFYDHRLCSVVVTGNAGAWIHHNLFVRNANAIQSFYADGRLLRIEDNDFHLNLSAIEAIEGDCGKIRQCRFFQDETSILCSSGGVVSVVDCVFANCDDAVIGEPNSLLLMDRVHISGCQDAVTLQSDEPTTVNPVAHADGTCEVLRAVTVQCCSNGLRVGNRRDAQLQQCRVQMCAEVGIELTAPSGNSILAGLPSSVLVVEAMVEGCRQGIVIHGDACTPRVASTVVQFCGTGLSANDGCMPVVDGLTVMMCVRGLSTCGYATGSYRHLNVSGCEAGIVVGSGEDESPLFQHCTIFDCNAVGLHLNRGAGGQFLDGTIFECGVGIMCAEGAYTYLAHTRVNHPSNNTITKHNDALRVAKFSGPRLGPNIELIYQSTPAHNGRTARMRRIDRDKAREAHQEDSLPAALKAWDAEQATLRAGIQAVLSKFGMSSARMQTLPSEIIEDAPVSSSEAKKGASFYSARSAQPSLVSLAPAAPPAVASILRLEMPMAVTSDPLTIPTVLQDVLQRQQVNPVESPDGSAGANTAQLWTHEYSHKAILHAVKAAETPKTLPPRSPGEDMLPSPTSATAPTGAGAASATACKSAALAVGFVDQMDPLRFGGEPRNTTRAADATASAQGRLPFDVHVPVRPFPNKVASERSKASQSPIRSPHGKQLNALFAKSTASLGTDGSGGGSSSSDTDTVNSSRRFRPLRAAHLRRRDSTVAAVYSLHELRSMEDNAEDETMAASGSGADHPDGDAKRLLPPLPLEGFRQRAPYPPHVAYTRLHQGASLEDLKLAARRPNVPSQTALRLLRHAQADKCSHYSVAVMEAVDAVSKKHNTIFADQLLSVFQELDPRGIEGVTAMDVVGFLEDVVERCEQAEENDDGAAVGEASTEGRRQAKRRKAKRVVGAAKSHRRDSSPGKSGDTVASKRKEKLNATAAQGGSAVPRGDESATAVDESQLRRGAVHVQIDRNGASFLLVAGLDVADEEISAYVASTATGAGPGAGEMESSTSSPAEVTPLPTSTVVGDDIVRHLLLMKYVAKFFDSVGKVPEKDVLNLLEFESLVSAKIDGAMRAYLKLYFPWMDMAQPMEELTTAVPVGGDALGRLGKQRRVAPLK